MMKYDTAVSESRMPLTYNLDLTLRLVIVKGTGVVSDADVLDCQRQVHADPQFDPTFDQLSDYTAVLDATGVTSNGLRQVAALSRLAPGCRRAYVVSAGLTFGLLRMFQVFRDQSPDVIKIFHSADDALAWLGRQSSDSGKMPV